MDRPPGEHWLAEYREGQGLGFFFWAVCLTVSPSTPSSISHSMPGFGRRDTGRKAWPYALYQMETMVQADVTQKAFCPESVSDSPGS